LLEWGERIFHIPGVAINRARDAYGGETKSDPRDARLIADQLRLRWRSRYLKFAFGGKLQPRCERWSATAESWSRSTPDA
jgi:hypothetical protein